MYWGVDLYSIGIPLGKPFYRGFSSMRGTIIRNPEDTPCRPIRLLLHDQVHQLVVQCYSRCSLAYSQELGSVDVPSGNVGPGAHSVIFKLHQPCLMRPGTDTDGLSVTGLDTGLFVGTDHFHLVPKGFRRTIGNTGPGHEPPFLPKRGSLGKSQLRCIHGLMGITVGDNAKRS